MSSVGENWNVLKNLINACLYASTGYYILFV